MNHRFRAPAGTQLVQERQHHQWQVMACTAQTFQVGRQQLQALEQRAQAVASRGDLTVGQVGHEHLQLLGKARCPRQLQHHQATVYLVQVVRHEGE